jgi:hypothetical protein
MPLTSMQAKPCADTDASTPKLVRRARPAFSRFAPLCRVNASGLRLLVPMFALMLAMPSSEVGAQTVPDLSGVWMAFTVENPSGDGNTPTYTPAGEAALDAFVAQFSEIPEVGAACVGTGLPSVMLSTVSYPIEFVQTASRIVMIAELETQVRRVFIDGRDRPEATFPSSVGYSIGTWEGDTLVIETTALEEWPLRPWPRSEDARVTERIYLTKLGDISARPTGFVASLDRPDSDDVLVVDITLDDPAYYEGPERRIAYYQRMPDSATMEYGCSKGLWQDELEARRLQ